MSILSRLSNLFKPTTRSRTAPPPKVFFYEEDRAFDSDVWPMLRAVIGTQEEDSPEVKRAAEALRNYARRNGFLSTAAQVRLQLRSLHGAKDADKSYAVGRGFVLAADLIFHHILEEIDAIQTEGKRVGPNGFRLTCNDLVDCLMMTKNVRRSIEIPILAVDKLLVQAVDHKPSRDRYLDLAMQALESSGELLLQRYSQEQEHLDEERQAAEEGRPIGRTRVQKPIHARVDGPLVLYVQQFRSDFDALRNDLLKSNAESPLTDIQIQQVSDPAKVQAHYSFLQSMLGVAQRSPYQAFSAWITERAGTFLLQLDPTKSREFFRAAAEAYEAQGNREAEVHLTKLATIRYEKAHTLYTRSEETQKAAEAHAKLEHFRPLS